MKNFSIVTCFTVFLIGLMACSVHAADLTEIPNVHVFPSIRNETLDQKPIFTIKPKVITPFLSQPFVLDASDIEAAPRIVATQEGRVFLGEGHTAYVSGNLHGNDGRNALFQVFRPSKPLIDPMLKQVIAHEATYLGSLKLQRRADANKDLHTFVVEQSKEEMGVGDRLLVRPIPSLSDYVPRLPNRQFEARIVAIEGGMDYAGQHQVVVINRGMQDGVDIGTVLAVSKSANRMVNKIIDNSLKLPDESYGVMLIFSVFEHVSYGLIMQVTDAVRVGDVAKSPE